MDSTLIKEYATEQTDLSDDSKSAEKLKSTLLAATDLPPGCTEPHLVQTHRLSDFIEHALRHPTIRTDASLYRRVQVALSCSCELREHVTSTIGSEDVKVKLIPISALLSLYKELHPQCTCDLSILRHILQPIEPNADESSDDMAATNQELECETCSSSSVLADENDSDAQPKPFMKELARQKLRDIVIGSELVNPIAPTYTASDAFKASLERLRRVFENEKYEASVGDLRGAPTLRATSLADIKWERAAVPSGPSPHLFAGHKVPEEVKQIQPKVPSVIVRHPLLQILNPITTCT